MDMPQKRMSPSEGDRTSATVSRTCDHAICGQLCSQFGAEQQHDRLQIHSDVGPLGPAQIAIDVAEQGGGRAETVPVGDSRPLARFPVLTRNPGRAVALLAKGGSALAVRGSAWRGTSRTAARR